MKRANKKSKRKISFFKITAIFLLIISVITCFLVYKLNVLPNKYLIPVVLILVFINLICDIFLLRKRSKKSIRIFLSFISFVVMMFMIFVDYYILNTFGFLDKIRNNNYKTENYSVIVLDTSTYKKIEDINGLKVGYYSNSVGYKKANNKLLKEVKVKLKKYTDSLESVSELFDKKISAVCIEDSVLDMLEEDNVDLHSQIRVIYKFSVKVKANTSAKDVDVTGEPFSVYISGIDTYGKISSVSRSDVNMVVTVNPKTKQVLLMSIPRDYYVKLHGKTGLNDKLTHAGMYGVDMSIQTIEDLLDIDINYYVKVNFTSVVDIVNALGGINVNSEYAFRSIDGYRYAKGDNKLNGEAALSFARERKAFASGDRQRVRDQQIVLEAIIKKMCSKAILTKYTKLLNSLKNDFETNMSTNKITSLIKMQLNDMSDWTISSYLLEGLDSREYTYSGGNIALYVMLPVDGSIDMANDLIHKVLNGEVLEEKTYSYSGDMTTSVTSSGNVNASYKQQSKIEDKSKEFKKNNKKSLNYAYPNCKNPDENNICLSIDTIDAEQVEFCEKGENTGNGCSIINDEEEQIIDYSIKYICSEGELDEDTNKCTVSSKLNVCDSGYIYDRSYQICCPSGYKYDNSTRKCVEN